MSHIFLSKMPSFLSNPAADNTPAAREFIDTLYAVDGFANGHLDVPFYVDGVLPERYNGQYRVVPSIALERSKVELDCFDQNLVKSGVLKMRVNPIPNQPSLHHALFSVGKGTPDRIFNLQNPYLDNLFLHDLVFDISELPTADLTSLAYPNAGLTSGVFTLNTCRNVSVYNIEIRGGFLGGNGAIGIYSGCQWITLHDLVLSGRTGVRSGRGVWVDGGKNITIGKSEIISDGYAGIVVAINYDNNNGSENVKIEGCNLHGTTPDGLQAGISMVGKGHIVSNCHVESRYQSVKVGGGNDGYPSDNVLILDNDMFTHAATRPTISFQPRDINDPASLGFSSHSKLINNRLQGKIGIGLSKYLEETLAIENDASLIATRPYAIGQNDTWLTIDLNNPDTSGLLPSNRIIV